MIFFTIIYTILRRKISQQVDKFYIMLYLYHYSSKRRIGAYKTFNSAHYFLMLLEDVEKTIFDILPKPHWILGVCLWGCVLF